MFPALLPQKSAKHQESSFSKEPPRARQAAPSGQGRTSSTSHFQKTVICHSSELTSARDPARSQCDRTPKRSRLQVPILYPSSELTSASYPARSQCDRTPKRSRLQVPILYVSIGDPQRANKTLPDGLSIRRTTLKGTQYGVFATKPLPKRIFFGPYEGVRRETLQMPETRFLRKVHTGTKGRQVDGRPLALSNWMRYVNSAPAGQDPNLVAFERAGAIYYRTCKAVGAFEELLLLDETADTRKSSASGTQKKDSLRPREVFSCTKCGDCFSSQMYLERHDRHHHTERPQGAHSCSTCSYSTNQRWRLDQHSLTHTGERPYVCEICKKDFTWRTDLNVHLLAHTQERPYECPECGERFNCPSHLQRHKKMHSRDPRPHVCPDCGKCYARKDYLKVHLLTHVAERRYECAECGRKFADPSNARHHYLFVHAKQYPLSCPHCGKGFASRRDVRRHVRARHDGQED
ncbi:histone-lysine N-methyltransferase PRDM9-like isoform X5 [Dermacentor albipictus]|uniref:histone-lysine N-methyltransferase PRDM9-like isoform X5 n=1 Tax=Dermacentor albipictus TaxID=60249 RepID=UPI0031FBECA8